MQEIIGNARRFPPKNNFRKQNLKIGKLIQILEVVQENKYYAIYEIIDIYHKKGFDMYLCKNIKTKCNTTFTDKDFINKERGKIKILEV